MREREGGREGRRGGEGGREGDDVTGINTNDTPLCTRVLNVLEHLDARLTKSHTLAIMGNQ